MLKNYALVIEFAKAFGLWHCQDMAFDSFSQNLNGYKHCASVWHESDPSEKLRVTNKVQKWCVLALDLLSLFQLN